MKPKSKDPVTFTGLRVCNCKELMWSSKAIALNPGLAQTWQVRDETKV